MKYQSFLKSTTPASLIKVASVCMLTLGLAACGGGSSGDEQPVNDSTGSNTDTGNNNGTGSSTPVNATTEEIQRAAARSVSSGMRTNLDALQSLSEEAMEDVQPGSIGADLVGDLNFDSLSQLDNNNSNFMNNTLGLDDANAVVTRDGNLISIDPDENRVCSSEFPLLEMAGLTLNNCEQLMSELTVEIQALTDESGVITYSMQNDDLIVINYAADAMSYELRLAPLQQLSQRSDELSGFSANNSGIVDGALRLSAAVTNDEPDAVSGELALEVTEALSFRTTDTIEQSLSLAPSTVFRVSLDEATGNVTTSVDWGALQLIADVSDFEDGTSMSEVSLAGLTAAATFNANTSVLSMSNLGIKDTPFRVNINQVTVIEASLSTFDVTIDAEQNQIVFDGALGALFTVNNLMGTVPEYSTDTQASISINAAAGTTLRGSDDGSTQVLNSGPFGVSASAVSNGVSLQQSVSFNQGECFISNEDVDAGLGIDLVAIACP